ncbi:PREDICTED: protein FAM163B [Pterocles gutturalis]|uniref:protein FAM163B n=1 Tax=Pterocles gutturalis TaxID=240206 RepID=UPI00052896FF|nr:PREDICTED: protein FAM163B [Pterocles gutturalis]
MTAVTVVITGGILATVILLCIIAVLCYCRLQVRLGRGMQPQRALRSPTPPLHGNRNVVLTNGPSLYASSPFGKKPALSRPDCPSCVPYEPPTFFLQEPPEELHNGGDRVSYQTVSQEDLDLPVSVANLQALNPNRLSAMREAFSRSRSISTDV